MERLTTIKNLIEEELDEIFTNDFNARCENDVRNLNILYNIKNMVNLLIRAKEHQCNDENCSCHNK